MLVSLTCPRAFYSTPFNFLPLSIELPSRGNDPYRLIKRLTTWRRRDNFEIIPWLLGAPIFNSATPAADLLFLQRNFISAARVHFRAKIFETVFISNFVVGDLDDCNNLVRFRLHNSEIFNFVQFYYYSLFIYHCSCIYNNITWEIIFDIYHR